MTAVETEGTTTLQKGAVGQSIPRKEDERLVQGQGIFVDDVRRHGMGYVHLVRSPYAHARIVSIDVSAAEAAPGVIGTLTSEEVAELTDPVNRFQVVRKGYDWKGPAFDVSGMFVWGFTGGLLAMTLSLGGFERDWDHGDVRDLDVALAEHQARVDGRQVPEKE